MAGDKALGVVAMHAMLPGEATDVARLFVGTDPEVFPEAFGPVDAMARYVGVTCGQDVLLSTGRVMVATVDGVPAGICVACDSVPGFVSATDAGVEGLSPSFDGVMADQATDVRTALHMGYAAYIECLSVDEAHRGQGIGRALLGDAIARHGSLLLMCRADNDAALALYRSVGFSAIGMTFGISEDGEDIGPAMLVMGCGKAKTIDSPDGEDGDQGGVRPVA